jgi:hypothetical protein
LTYLILFEKIIYNGVKKDIQGGEKMRVIKSCIVVIFLTVTIVFSVNYYKEKVAQKNSMPTIDFGESLIKVSIKDDEDILLKDVIAKDAEDGDITNNIVIESISKFVDKKKYISNITYAVSDSDNHVVKKTRQVQYTDYRKPRFTLSQPLCFDAGSDVDVTDVLGAIDDVDGDISDKVKILSSVTSTRVAGSYVITAQVTNSLGATSTIKATVTIREGNNLNPTIKLKKNIVYLKVGDSFEPEKYVDSVKDSDGKKMSNDLVKVVKSSVNTEKAGYYTVEYAINYEQENEEVTYLVVVVEG